MADIEELNRLRAAMGVPLLPVPGAEGATSGPTFKQPTADNDSDDEPASTLETREAAGFDNWKKLQEEKDAKARRDARNAAIKKEREKADRERKIEGKGLADEAGDEDTLAWIKNAKKRQKKIAKAEKLREEQEEQERQAKAAMQYTESDLAGVKVGHDAAAFGEGEEEILVLKDTAVDQDEDDELEALAVKDKERVKEKLDAKKRTGIYNPNTVDEDGQGSILAQYDEEINGKKRKAFTLDGQGRTVEDLAEEAAGDAKRKKIAISLDIVKKDEPANDYMDISEIKVKKPKKKKSKSTRRKHTDDNESTPIVEEQAMEVDEPAQDTPQSAAPQRKQVKFDDSIFDDEDLQARLAAQRREALKKNRKKVALQDVVARIKGEDPTSAAASRDGSPDVMLTTETDIEPAEEDSGLLIDPTYEFVEALKSRVGDSEELAPRSRKSRQPSKGTDSLGGVESAGGFKSVGSGYHSLVPSGADEDVDMDESYGALQDQASEEGQAQRERSVSADIKHIGFEEETVDRGVASTLKLLRQRNMIDHVDSADQNAAFRAKASFLASKRMAQEFAEMQAKQKRANDREAGKHGNMSTRDREEQARNENKNRELKLSRELGALYDKEYVPNIDISYFDDHGRKLNQKEAFKHMSHQFHGKGSGNQKTQKHLEKIEAEKKKLAQSSLDSSKATGAIGNALSQQARKHKQAGVRLQ